MDRHNKADLEEALKAIDSMIDKSEKAQMKFRHGTSQHTLQKNRIKSLYTASALISNGLAEGDASIFLKEDLEQAIKPITSLISKSEKAQMKLSQETWQYKMLENNLKALYIALPLLEKYLQ